MIGWTVNQRNNIVTTHSQRIDMPHDYDTKLGPCYHVKLSGQATLLIIKSRVAQTKESQRSVLGRQM